MYFTSEQLLHLTHSNNDKALRPLSNQLYYPVFFWFDFILYVPLDFHLPKNKKYIK